MLTFEQFEQIANRLFDRIPPRLLEGLNGGIILSEEAMQRDPDLPDVYIMGEYVDDPYGLGKYIVIYYGSFCKVLDDADPKEWEEELWETVVHEIRHHVEGQAGVSDLEVEDMIELERFRDEYRD